MFIGLFVMWTSIESLFDYDLMETGEIIFWGSTGVLGLILTLSGFRGIKSGG